MRSRLWTSLIGIVVVTVALLVYNEVEGNEPKLGLDLQGGASVVLEPTTPADREDLEFVSELVRDAVDSLGIAEPDVRVEGSTIVVDLPGVNDQRRALELVNVSGEVSLHPVLQCAGPVEEPTDESTPPASPTSSPAPPPTSTPASIPTSAPASVPVSSATSAGTPTTLASGWRAATPTSPPGTTDDEAPANSSPDSAAETTTATSVPTSEGSLPVTAPSVPEPTTTTTPWFVATTEPSYPITNPDGSLVLQTRADGICAVGPSGGTGQVFSRKSASAALLQGAWGVTADLSGDGVASWNALASQCFSRSESCPSGQLAIALDDVIQSAPTVQAPSFPDTVSITGIGDESDARELAAVLNRGAYPFDVQPQTIQGVSASSGKEALDAVLIAGAVGIALVLAFMLLYYRALALVIIGGLVLSAGILYGVISLLSAQRNLTLTIAGSAGIIVSVGVTIDSYVVFFERLKDEVRHGRSLRNSASRGFSASWRTIVNGNLSSLIGALVLFWLSVGSVRGFAFFLAISTIIDMIVAYFFTRPVVLLLARSGRVGTQRVFGIDTSARNAR